ncbi:GGDEF domain-containing protein [Allonocardiopsis opalescens]|uniref:GGDEF domain-containing protein n=1 Tax=Allonocardiopsis opalescens TaxID=1144618 RepID=UPI000D04BB79|nr:GGDEF domain-containing protein [Allonocardiopsis opalescens]
MNRSVKRVVRGVPQRNAATLPLLAQPKALIAYVATVVALEVVLAGYLLVHTPIRVSELVLFAAVLACGAACVEAIRRLGMPAGVVRDLLSAWWLPVALLLPSIYALLAPIPLYALLQLRVRRTLVFRRVLNAAAIGLSGAAAGVVFRWFVPEPLGNPSAWLGDGRSLMAAVGCGVLFAVTSTALVAVAAYSATPELRWRDVLWDGESLLLDLVELCVGVLVTLVCAMSTLLIAVTLPPVILLQRSLLHQQLQAAARTDPKTGLLNAPAWQREADAEIARALRGDEDLSVLIVDIDHFKRVNDAHGHLVGDQVLVGVATMLTHQLREYDLVGRFGGEEFVVLLPKADLAEACRVAERLRNQVARMVLPAEGPATVAVTISVGVALLRAHGRDLIELLAAADLALYQAKDAGRDRVSVPAQPTAADRALVDRPAQAPSLRWRLAGEREDMA